MNRSLDDLTTVLRSYIRNLTPEERQKYGSIKEKNKLFANKVYDYRQAQPELSSPDVDWAEFEADYADRSFIETRLNRIMSMVQDMGSAKILHDYDNYQNALLDYEYTKYKAGTEGGGYSVKLEELKQFFEKMPPQNGVEETPPAAEE